MDFLAQIAFSPLRSAARLLWRHWQRRRRRSDSVAAPAPPVMRSLASRTLRCPVLLLSERAKRAHGIAPGSGFLVINCATADCDSRSFLDSWPPPATPSGACLCTDSWEVEENPDRFCGPRQGVLIDAYHVLRDAATRS